MSSIANLIVCHDYKNAFFSFIILSTLSFGGIAPAFAGLADNDQLIIGVDAPAVFSSAVPRLEIQRSYISPMGVTYLLAEAGGKIALTVTLAVLGNEQLAQSKLNEMSLSISVPPRHSDQDHKLGDRAFYWGSDDTGRGTIMFQRRNITVYMFGEVPKEKLSTVAGAIDALFVGSNTMVTKGERVIVPDISQVSLPQKVQQASSATFKVTVGNVAKDDIMLIGSGSTRVVWNGADQLEYYAPREPVKDVFDIIVATRGNVIASRRFEVVVE